MKRLLIAACTICLMLTSCNFTSLKTDNGEKEAYPKNYVTENPELNTVTNQIDKQLVGRYVAAEDKNMYFEIREDGSAEICLAYPDEYGVFYAEDLRLTALYQDPNEVQRVYLTFYLVNGHAVLPFWCGMAIDFVSEDHYKSFEPLIGDCEIRQTFVKTT